MPQCAIHPHIYHRPNQLCSECSIQNFKDWKDSHRRQKVEAKVKVKKKYTGSKTKYLKEKLQRLVAAKLKARFKNTPLWYCWQSNKRPVSQEGLFSLHCSHFYSRDSIWQLSDHIHNVFPSSYDQNVNRQSNVTSARPMLEKVYGKENMESLDRLAAYYIDAMNKGKERKRPTELQLMAMIEKNKNIVK